MPTHMHPHTYTNARRAGTDAEMQGSVGTHTAHQASWGHHSGAAKCASQGAAKALVLDMVL